MCVSEKHLAFTKYFSTSTNIPIKHEEKQLISKLVQKEFYDLKYDLVLLKLNFIRNPFQAFNSMIRKRLKNLTVVSKNIQNTVPVIIFIGLEDFLFHIH